MLNELDRLPDGLLSLQAHELASALGGPTLIHLQGRQTPALFISILMHGNETTGWEAMRQLLGQYLVGGGNRELPRSLSLFIGNVTA
ncbi:MAG: peptidase M14, partial [Sedimenticola sp.]|nr:peptidase M14 [Sedimenticola sp.]